MSTRIRLELDIETTRRLMALAVHQCRSMDWMAEVILMRALGTWDEDRTGEGVDLVAPPPPDPRQRTVPSGTPPVSERAKVVTTE